MDGEPGVDVRVDLAQERDEVLASVPPLAAGDDKTCPVSLDSLS